MSVTALLNNFAGKAQHGKLRRALQRLGVREDDVGRVLGSGSFGTAAILEYEHEHKRIPRVIKLTRDESEVRAAAFLVGKADRTPHVVTFYGAWFVEGLSIRRSRVGVVIAERVTALSGGYEQHIMHTLVNRVKTDEKAWPHQLRALKDPRARLLKAGLALQKELVEMVKKKDLQVCADVALALVELRDLGVYALDVHGGNIGYSDDDDCYKVFDVGVSSPPAGVDAENVYAGPGGPRMIPVDVNAKTVRARENPIDIAPRVDVDVI